MSHHKLSFRTALLVNLNVMFGTGIFINTVILAQQAGFFGFLTYLIVAILLVPLILCTGALLRLYPDGGFYAYAAKTIHPFAGFVSAWAYFTGKLASAALLVHVFSSLITTLIPQLAIINILFLDSIIICLFAWLNLLHMKTGKTIMYAFMVFKITPILFAILSCLYLYKIWSIPSYTLIWSGIPAAIPLVMFAFTGFEVCCSLSSSLENAKINGPRIVFLTYGFVVCITILYQLFFFLTAGPQLMAQHNFLGAFPTLFSILVPHNPMLAHYLTAILHIALACACLGGSYGILFSNHWNLYTLAQHNHTFFASLLKKLNHYSIPTACIIIEAFFCILYLFITHATVTILQQISVLGSCIAYTLSMCGLIKANFDFNFMRYKWLPWFALGSCAFLVLTCVRNLFSTGPDALYFFGFILLFGFCMFWVTSKKDEKLR